MDFLKRVLSKISTPFISLNILHSLNDAFEANYLLLLPFIVADLNINLIQVGTLGTLLSIFSIILAVPAGYIALRIGGIKTLIIALFIYAAGFVGVGLSQNYFQLLVVFTLGGIGLALFHPIAFALIAKWTPKENRGSAMGGFSAVGDLGKIGISTLLTFIVIYIGWQRTAMLYGIVTLLIGVGFYLLLFRRKDTFTAKEHTSTHVSMWHIVNNRKFLFAAATNVLDNFASQTLFVFLPFLLLARGFKPETLALYAGAFFIGSLTGRILLGRLVDRYDNTRVFIVSELLMAFFIFLLANTTPLFLLITCALILGIFTKGTTPIVKTMVSESVERHGNFERAYGINGISSNAAIAIAPLVLGFISEKFGIISAFNVMAVVALLAIIPAIGFRFTKEDPLV